MVAAALGWVQWVTVGGGELQLVKVKVESAAAAHARSLSFHSSLRQNWRWKLTLSDSTNFLIAWLPFFSLFDIHKVKNGVGCCCELRCGCGEIECLRGWFAEMEKLRGWEEQRKWHPAENGIGWSKGWPMELRWLHGNFEMVEGHFSLFTSPPNIHLNPHF